MKTIEISLKFLSECREKKNFSLYIPAFHQKHWFRYLARSILFLKQETMVKFHVFLLLIASISYNTVVLGNDKSCKTEKAIYHDLHNKHFDCSKHPLKHCKYSLIGGQCPGKCQTCAAIEQKLGKFQPPWWCIHFYKLQQ